MKCMGLLFLFGRPANSFSQIRRAPNHLLSRRMSSDATAAIDIARNLDFVRQRVEKAAESVGKDPKAVRLVAVSKTKPQELLMKAYDAGCRVFGENYAQELVEKTAALPKDIEWHFIGGLQSNKCNLLVNAFDTVNRLTLETVASAKLASKLQNAVTNKNPDETLKVYVQVNTSGEESKSGVEPSECLNLCRHVVENCPQLRLEGLMTIGAVGDLSCFDRLLELRDQVSKELELESLGLSMGMSGDFEEAIIAGATNVRVGSTIFGARDYSNNA